MEEPPGLRAVRWTGPAVADLEANFDFLAELSPGHASQVTRLLLEGAASLARFPERGQVYARDASVRSLLVSRYRLYYEVHGHAVVILRVWDMRRDPAAFELGSEDEGE